MKSFNRMMIFPVLLALAACGEGSAIEEAVKKTIKNDPGHCILYGKWPFQTPIFTSHINLKQAQALNRLGLAGIRKNGLVLNGKLTQEGMKYYYPSVEAPTRRIMMGGNGGLCIGKKKLIEVKSFTEPANAFGKIITEVVYTYEVTDFPGWSKELAGAFPSQARILQGSSYKGQGKMVLQKTNNGWLR